MARIERRPLIAALALGALLVLSPCALLRLGALTPREMSIDIGPLRLATPCYSSKRFCPAQPARGQPPPHELLVLLDWPDERRSEVVVLSVPLR
jgi:hypothetical protein